MDTHRARRLVLAAAAVAVVLPACHGSKAPAPGSFVNGISADGRFVVFASDSDRLVPGDTNGHRDVFVRDLRSGRTVLVSRPPGGGQANGESRLAAISADGRFVAFQSQASNLIAHDTNGTTDVFLWNAATWAIELVGPGTRPAISADGGSVAFESSGTVREWRRSTGRSIEVASGGHPSVSADGGLVAYQSGRGVFLWTLVTGASTRVAPGADPAISADGSAVAFDSAASSLVLGDTDGQVDVFIWDHAAGTILPVSWASGAPSPDGGSFHPAVSADGRVVAFDSAATDLVPGDTNGRTDVFVRDLPAGAIRRPLRGGTESNGDSFDPRLTADGVFVAFDSDASNILPGDDNGAFDVFVANTATGAIRLVSAPLR